MQDGSGTGRRLAVVDCQVTLSPGADPFHQATRQGRDTVFRGWHRGSFVGGELSAVAVLGIQPDGTHGLHQPFDMTKYKAMIDEGFDEIQQMDCNLIRIHIATSDITDAEGKLIENRWLDSLDYVLASAEQRGIYVYLSFLNNIGATSGSFVSKECHGKADWMVDPDFMVPRPNLYPPASQP
jgi:aryl-phospho-beta-D-glucosidase BglC (GH1 family)